MNQQKVETKQAQNKRACFFILSEAKVSFVDSQSGALSGKALANPAEVTRRGLKSILFTVLSHRAESESIENQRLLFLDSARNDRESYFSDLLILW